MSENPVAGWYADPTPGSTMLRYWDGSQWTEQYTDASGSTGASAPQSAQVAETPVYQQAQPVVAAVAEPVVAQPVYSQPPQQFGQATQQYMAQQYNPQYAQTPAYTYNQAGAPVPPSNGSAIAALILGIISFLSGWTLFGMLPGLIAIITGAIGAKKPYLRGAAIAGLILGILGFLSGVLLIVLIAILATTVTEAGLGGFLEEIMNMLSLY